MKTPLVDLVRGRVTGRLDVEWATLRAGLPSASTAVVAEVVKRSRLWTREKQDTARELAAHFRDGLEAGREESELIASFGDPKRAAALIRRAAKRKRPLIWHTWIRAWQALGCALLLALAFFAWTTARYWVATPKITRNFTAEMNAPVLARPESERGRALYVRAFALMGEGSGEPKFNDDEGRERVITPKDDEWPAMAAYADKVAPALALLGEASERPVMGFLYGHPMDQETDAALAAYLNYEPGHMESAPSANPSLISILLPHLSAMRRSAQFLCRVEALEAARRGDAGRFERAVATPLGMARQMCRPGTLVEQLVGYSILGLACETLQSTVRDYPSLIDDAGAARISHRLASVDTRMHFEFERQSMHDIAQRVYSDDGNGDGVITRKGMEELLRITADVAGGTGMSAGLGGAAVSAVAAGRKETLEVWDAWYDRVEALADSDAAPGELDRLHIEFDRGVESGSSWRHPLIRLLFPALGRAAKAGHEARMKRDGACVGLALEVFKRRTGAYPAALSEMVPGLLPEVPHDRYDGAPIRYRVRDGRPEVYSVGKNGKDDGGVLVGDRRWGTDSTGIAPDLALWTLTER